MAFDVTYQNKTYKFGFTRETAAAAQRDGLVIEELGTKPNLMVPLLVYHAATAYNKGIKRRTVDEIFEEMQDKTGFITALLEEYAEPMNSLFEDNEQGNATWKRG